MAIQGLENFKPKERSLADNPYIDKMNPAVLREIEKLQGTKAEAKIENNFLRTSREEQTSTNALGSEVNRNPVIRPEIKSVAKQIDTLSEVKGMARGVAGVVKDSMRLAHGFFNLVQGRRPTKFETARNNYRRKARSGPNLDKNYAKNLLKSAFPDTDLKNIDTKIAELERDGIDKNSREIKFLKDIRNSL